MIEPTGDRQIAGHTIRHPTAFSPVDFGAIFLATDAVEEPLARRCQALYGRHVTLLKPSELISLDNLGRSLSSEPSAQEKGPPSWPTAVGGYPRKIEGVLVCVRYSDFLAWTLPSNIRHFDRFFVVTSRDDLETQALASRCGARVVISDSYRENGVVFNKGRMLNAAFAEMDFDDWVVVTDADVVFPEGWRRRLEQRFLNRDCLYFATRVDAPEEDTEAWLTAYAKAPDLILQRPFTQPGSNRMPWGYFQLFHSNSRPLRENIAHIYPEDFPTAGEVDYHFQSSWPEFHKILLPETLVHIPHGQTGTNWRGRSSVQLLGAVKLKRR